MQSTRLCDLQSIVQPLFVLWQRGACQEAHWEACKRASIDDLEQSAHCTSIVQGHALIQFSSPVCAQSALVHLRGFTLFGRSLEISFSRHSYISIRPGSLSSVAATTTASPMVDGDTNFTGTGLMPNTTQMCVKEYGHGLNRFTGKYSHSTKHIYSPTRILHISNLDATATAEVHQPLAPCPAT